MNDLTWKEFEKVDIRVGTIISAENFKEAIKPAIKMTIDFGDEIGIKKSSAQITDHYDPHNLIGIQVAAVINFPNKQIGNLISEVLVLGFPDQNNEPVLISPSKKISDGGKLY
mgnify:CR=1 FL=1